MIIPVQQACQMFNVPVSVFLNSPDVAIVPAPDGNNTAIHVTAWSARHVSRKFKDTMSVSEACLTLGLPKAAVTHLLATKVFTEIGYLKTTGGAGRLCKKEIAHFNRQLINNSEQDNSPGSFASLASLINEYGDELHQPLIALIEGIKTGVIKAKRIDGNSLKSYLVDLSSFEKWLILARRHAKGLSVGEASKHMGINKRLLSQIIDAGLMEHHRYGRGELKHVTFEHINKFNQRYVLSSRLRDILDMGKKGLHKTLADQNVHAINIGKPKLNENVYLWEEVSTVIEMK
jgi:hypothetical protein